MRQINRKTRVPPRGALAAKISLDNGDFQTGIELGQTVRGAKPGKAATDHHDICGDIAFQRRFRAARRQHRALAQRFIVHRQFRDTFHCSALC